MSMQAMGEEKLTPGEKAPREVSAFIEISAHGYPAIKYEIDEASGVLFVDRIVHASMAYPFHYGFVPGTLAPDGDSLDVIVLCHESLVSGTVVRVRPVGVLFMIAETGNADDKVLAVPVSAVTSVYDNVKTHRDLPAHLIARIEHFFMHYRDLEPEKWGVIKEWGDDVRARDLICRSIQDFRERENGQRQMLKSRYTEAL